MAEELIISTSTDREEVYNSLIPQIKSLITHEKDEIANLANISAALKQSFNFLWVGFYIVKGNQLVLGPFQGPIACTRIDFDKGVCGYCYSSKKTIIVDDVEKFPGHIACSSGSRSEIVLPVFDNEGKVKMVLDIDSNQLNDFNETDKIYLEELIREIEKQVK